MFFLINYHVFWRRRIVSRHWSLWLDCFCWLPQPISVSMAEPFSAILITQLLICVWMNTYLIWMKTNHWLMTLKPRTPECTVSVRITSLLPMIQCFWDLKECFIILPLIPKVSTLWHLSSESVRHGYGIPAMALPLWQTVCGVWNIFCQTLQSLPDITP